MARAKSRSPQFNPTRGTRARRAPAFPKVGTGEDFPAHRPGTRVGETRWGQKIMQMSRGTQTARMRYARKGPLPEQRIPLARPRRGEPFQARTPNWTGGRPTGRRQWPFSTGVRGKATREYPWPL